MSQPTSAEISKEVQAAENRIRPHIRETYLDYSQPLSELSGAEVFLKLENLQLTGSFKLRGALSKLLSLSPSDGREIVTASTGNHALAVAHALRLTGRNGIIYLPEGAAPGKLEALRRLGVPFQQHGRDPVESEQRARREARGEDKVYVSPYNDAQVIGGQGTVGLEIWRQLPGVDAVFVAVGGGGLIAGIGACLKARRPDLRVVGCLPENAPVMYESVRSGRIVQLPYRPTLSDATAGALEEGAITFPLCRQLVDDYFLVSEPEILEAMRLLIRTHHLLVEGSAAVSLAAFSREAAAFRGRKVVLVMCGGNVDLETVERVVCRT